MSGIHPVDAMLVNRDRRLGFHAWMARVDRLVQDHLGCSVHDLPDCPFADYADGMVPASAARKAIRAARES